MTSQADAIAAALRAIAPRGKLAGDDVPLINQLGALWDARLRADPVGGAGVAVADPAWTVAARRMMGLHEIHGPQHNPTILGFWALDPRWKSILKTDDSDSPWCGGFQAYAMHEAGIAFPADYPRAGAWKSWGTPCQPQVGAIGVKSRKGGNHVFQIVGQTGDGVFFKALGGNQNDQVSIIDIRKTDVDAIRWPPNVPEAHIPLPTMKAGTLHASEA